MLKNIYKITITWYLEGLRKRAYAKFQVVKGYEAKLKAFEAEEEKRAEEMFQKMKAEIVKEERMEKRIFNDYMVWKVALRLKLIEEIGKCEKCGTSSLRLTIDHIIPAFTLRDLGMTVELERDERNLRLLCRLCNSLKAHHLDFTDLRTKPLLMEYLQKFPGPEKFVDLIPAAVEVVYPPGMPIWFKKQYDRIHS